MQKDLNRCYEDRKRAIQDRLTDVTSAESSREQLVDWAHGNARCSNTLVTREMAEEVVQKSARARVEV